MNRENSKHLTKLKQALERLEQAETRLQIKNARRALTGAIRSLKAHAVKAYPLVAKQPKPIPFETRFLKGDGPTQRGLERDLAQWIRDTYPTWYWKTREVQEFVNAVGDRCATHFEPVTLMDPPYAPNQDMTALMNGAEIIRESGNFRVEYGRCDVWTPGAGGGARMDAPKSCSDQARLVWVLHKLTHAIRMFQRGVRFPHGRGFREIQLLLIQIFISGDTNRLHEIKLSKDKAIEKDAEETL